MNGVKKRWCRKREIGRGGKKERDDERAVEEGSGGPSRQVLGGNMREGRSLRTVGGKGSCHPHPSVLHEGSLVSIVFPVTWLTFLPCPSSLVSLSYHCHS